MNYLQTLASKTCRKCHKDKSLELFHKKNSSSDGFCHTCKSCRKLEAKTRRLKGGEDFKKRCNESMKQWRAANPDKNKESCRRHNLRRSFGIDDKDYQKLFDAQSGLCAICHKGETMIVRGNLYRLAVDHDHETGRVRGLLCCKCNRAIGLLCHEPAILEQALSYLRQHQST